MRFTDVEKKYGERVAIRISNLTLEEGKITAVLGESGAGKTTLLNCAAGLVPYSGKIEGAGRVSYLFQSPKLLPNLCAEDNLKFVLPKELFPKAGEMLARVGLAGMEKRYPRELSGGEKQRVAIARAFLYPHDTLFMDEPFASLDLSLKRSLLSLVTELAAESKETVLFVTHDVHEAALLASRAIVLRKGELVADYLVGEPFPRDFFQTQPVEENLVRALMQDSV